MNVSQAEFNQAVLAVTSGTDWDIVKQGLSNDVYQVQSGALDAKTWELVCEARGFAQGLAYMINIRENTIKAINIELDNNADV